MKPKIYLAPMSGVTDLAFRLMCRKFGARHCFFEMVDSNAILYERPQTKYILKTIKKDRPISVQLLGADPSVMLSAAETILSFTDVSSLDINSACPAKKVVKKGAGAALLKDPPKLGKIIKKLALKLKVPVTVKLRTGVREKNIDDCIKVAKVCEANGATTIFIHGRTLSQGYSGGIDYESIRVVKEAVHIPVFGSGNIFDPISAKKMLDETGCDGILVARGAQGNPWIFKDIETFLKNGKLPRPVSLNTKKKVLREHLSLVEKYKGKSHSGKVGFMGAIATWYLKGIPNASKIRDQVFRTKTYGELIKLITDL